MRCFGKHERTRDEHALHDMVGFTRLLGAVLLLCTAPATWAQGKVDDKLMQRYGGVLAPECGNYLLPQLLYLGDSLVVQDGGKAMLTGRNVKAAPTYFGAKPPPEFETAFTSEVAGGDALIFVFYRNASGLFAAVEGGPKVMAAATGRAQGKARPTLRPQSQRRTGNEAARRDRAQRSAEGRKVQAAVHAGARPARQGAVADGT